MTLPLWALKISGAQSRVPSWVWIALAVCLIWYWERDRHADAREAEVRAEEQAAHAVTKASLEALATDLARLVREGEERAQRVSQAKERASREALSLKQDIARLKRADTSDPCRTPREVLEAGL
jgi:hypothetical protein